MGIERKRFHLAAFSFLRQKEGMILIQSWSWGHMTAKAIFVSQTIKC